MELKEILNQLVNTIHTIVLATVDNQGYPYSAAIDMMLEDGKAIYFLTARGKSIYQRLEANPYIALTGIKGEDTMSSISISLHGKVKPIGKEKLDEIFIKNPYMKKIYPNQQAQEVLEVFKIEDYEGEYFDLSCQPIYRQSFASINTLIRKAYWINEKCVKCNQCVQVCPQGCIKQDDHYSIVQEHCLHCGKCFEICKYQSISKEE